MGPKPTEWKPGSREQNRSISHKQWSGDRHSVVLKQRPRWINCLEQLREGKAGWRHSSTVEHLPSISSALGSSPSFRARERMNEYTTRLIKTSEKGHTAEGHTVIVRTVCEVCQVPETPKGGTTSFGTRAL